MSTRADTATARIPQWTLGDRLRKAREEAGISVAGMAERLGIARNTLSTWEHDKVASVPMLGVKAYADICNVPIWWLAGGDDDAPADVTSTTWYPSDASVPAVRHLAKAA